MARQFPVARDIECLRYSSWYLCRLLDRIISTEEEVAFRRKCNAMNYYIISATASYEIVYSGSKGEGFKFQSSDEDLMFINQNTLVLESVHNAVGEGKTLLLMRREGSSPGFVILELLNRTDDYHISESIVDYCGHSVVSSLLYRDKHRLPKFEQVGHGPCNTSHYPFETDIAHCFECNTWPTEAYEFIYRKRLYSWSQKDLLDKIVCRGCHLVPIGDKDPDLTHIQWRLSFSAAEKDLVLSFNHTQFLVYGLMKIFLKQYIDIFHFLHGILCSYFLKTAMFYCIESTPCFLWRDDLLIPCFWICLNKLISWVEQGYCPNYFVPQNNMFRNKVFGNIQQKLLDVLNQCKHVGWTCLFLCEDLRALQIIVSYPVLSRNCNMILSDKQIESSLDISVADTASCLYYIGSGEQKVIGRALILLSHARTQQEKEISTLLVHIVQLNIGQSNFCIGVSTMNKDKYKTLRKRQRSLSISSLNIGYLGMVTMATFYYEIGQYQKAVRILERVILIWKPYVLFLSREHKLAYHTDLYVRYVCGQGKSVKEKARFYLVNDITISKGILYPAEIFYDVEATYPFPLIVPPLPYTLFLLFLCHHKLGNIDKSLFALHDLEILQRDDKQGGRQYPVVINILAICLDKLGNKQRALEMCLLSQELRPDRNRADRLFDRILSHS